MKFKDRLHGWKTSITQRSKSINREKLRLNIVDIFLLLCETWLGYVFWTLTEIFIYEEYFIILDVARFDWTPILGVLVYLFPVVVALWRPVLDFLAGHIHELRVFGGIAFFFLIVKNNETKLVFAAVATGLYWLSWLCAVHYLSRHDTDRRSRIRIPKPNKVKDFLTSQVYPLKHDESSRFIWGLLYGLLLIMTLKQFWVSVNPIWVNAATKAVFGALTILACICLTISHYWFRLRNHTRSTVTPGAGDTPVPPKSIPEFSSRVAITSKNPLWLDAFGWLFTGFSLGGILFTIQMMATTSDFLPRYVGWAPFPVDLAVFAAYILGLVLAFFFRNNILWYPLIFIGIPLYIYLINAAGFIGGLIAMLFIPLIFWQIMKELRHSKALWITFLFAFFWDVFWIGAYAGAIVGDNISGFGGLFLGHRERFMWPLFTSLGAFLIIRIIRVVYFSSFDFKIDRFRHKSRRGYILRKLVWVNQKATVGLVTVLVLLLILVGVAFLVRAVAFTGTTAVPVAGTKSVAVTGSKAVPTNPRLRVMTYNIIQGSKVDSGSVNLQDISNVISDYSPDLVGLQESDSMHFLTENRDSIAFLSSHLDYRSYYGFPVSHFTLGAGVLSRYPLHSCHTYELPQINQMMYQYPLVECKIEFLGTYITWIDVHTTFRDEDEAKAAQAQADFIAAKIRQSSGPLIVTGDFNTKPLSPHYNTIIAAGVQDSYVAATGSFGPHTRHDTTIDYIFFRNLTVLYVDVVEEAKGLSDHLPKIADFTL